MIACGLSKVSHPHLTSCYSALQISVENEIWKVAPRRQPGKDPGRNWVCEKCQSRTLCFTHSTPRTSQHCYRNNRWIQGILPCWTNTSFISLVCLIPWYYVVEKLCNIDFRNITRPRQIFDPDIVWFHCWSEIVLVIRVGSCIKKNLLHSITMNIIIN